jgi:mannose-6-phosphate isomerase-like protein (cupin superfamily)
MFQVRRVVTGQSQTGRAKISADGPVPNVFGADGGPVLVEIWKTTSTPATLTDAAEEPAAGPWVLEPPRGGSVMRIAEIPPDEQMSKAAAHPVFDQIGEPGRQRAAIMHRTSTLDYAIVLQGRITLVVEDGETDLNEGDVVIQRGANHAWSNRTNEPCRMAFVMLDARYT